MVRLSHGARLSRPTLPGNETSSWVRVGQNRWHASRYRPSLRLGRRRYGHGGPQGGGPSKNRVDRTRCAGGTDPPRGWPALPPPIGRASRRRRSRRCWWRTSERRWSGQRQRHWTSLRPRHPNRSSPCRFERGRSIFPRTSPSNVGFRTRAVPTPSCTAKCWPKLARERGWVVHCYSSKDVEEAAARILGERAGEVLYGPRATLGPPWSKDHRMALAATIVVNFTGRGTDLLNSSPRTRGFADTPATHRCAGARSMTEGPAVSRSQGVYYCPGEHGRPGVCCNGGL